MALSADTTIHTLTGDFLLKKLAAHGDHVHGFCWAGKQIGVTILRFGEVRTAEILRVVLDNGRSFFCTPDTLFADRFTQEETPPSKGQRVLPLYLKLRDGRPMFRQMREDLSAVEAPADRSPFRSVARMVYEWSYGESIPRGVAVRHRDGNQQNCLPSNLYLHGKPKAKRKHKIAKLRELQQSLISNHQIIGFEQFGEDEVVDVYTESASFFAAGEVFVKGSHGA